MRTSWTVSGLILAATGAALFAAALGVRGLFPLPLHVLLGEAGGSLLSMGALVLFFEWKDHRQSAPTTTERGTDHG